MQISLYIKFENIVLMLPIDSKAVGMMFALFLILYFKIIFPFLFIFSFLLIRCYSIKGPAHIIVC